MPRLDDPRVADVDLKEKARAFQADAEIQAALREARLHDAELDALSRRFTPEAAGGRRSTGSRSLGAARATSASTSSWWTSSSARGSLGA